MSRKNPAGATPAKSRNITRPAQKKATVARKRTQVSARTTEKKIVTAPTRIAVVEERLDVGKRTRETGGIRLRKRVHHDQVVIDELLQADSIDVQRIAVGRVLEGPVDIRNEGDVMIVPIVEERMVTRKELVLVEEIRITRHTTQRRAPQTFTVRREEVIAERLDPASGEWKDERAS